MGMGGSHLMVDRAAPPSTGEWTMLRNNGVAVVAGYVGGPNRYPNYWSLSDFQTGANLGFSMVPIYVGQNYCPQMGCTWPVLTVGQGQIDGQEAVTLARQYGFNGGILIDDMEACTYWDFDKAGTNTYCAAWAAQVASEGFYPVIYGTTEMVNTFQPTVNCGYWLANWDNVGNLAAFPNAAAYGIIGWQFSDQWNGFDASHVDDGWVSSTLPVGGSPPEIPTPPPPYTPSATGQIASLSDAWSQFVAQVEQLLPYYYSVVVGLRSNLTQGGGGGGGHYQ